MRANLGEEDVLFLGRGASHRGEKVHLEDLIASAAAPIPEGELVHSRGTTFIKEDLPLTCHGRGVSFAINRDTLLMGAMAGNSGFRRTQITNTCASNAIKDDIMLDIVEPLRESTGTFPTSLRSPCQQH